MVANNYLNILDHMEHMTEKELENSVTILKEQPAIDTNKRVYVYYNLHKKIWSVRQSGKVVAHTKNIMLRDAKFLVSKAGQARVRREKKKNVHAGVSGYVVDSIPVSKLSSEAFLTYNPYKHDGFVAFNDPYEIVKYADYVQLECGVGVRSVWACWFHSTSIGN
tara:strand:+ start:1938 stop:2429 length:492 start_codon:yes stop_codon:yes gene_type:complete